MTKVAVFGDNGVGRWFAQLFDACPDVQFFLSEKNKSGMDVTQRHKRILSSRQDLRLALKQPRQALQRLRENGFDSKLDFHYFELEQAVAANLFDVALTKSERSLHTLASLKRKYNNFKLVYWTPFTIPFVDLFDDRSFLIRQNAWDAVDLFVAITKTCRDTLLFEGIQPERVAHIYPGIDLAQFRPRDRGEARRAIGIEAGAFHLLFVGKLVSWKGCFTLLYALKLLRQQSRDVRLTMVGSGAQRGKLEKAVELLGLAGCVEFRGNVPYGDIPDYYSAADVFVLPALPAINMAEQFGYVVAEAMACGVPALVSRVGGLPETVGYREELIFNPGDYRQLAERIDALIANPELRQQLSEHVQNHATKHYDAGRNGLALDKALSAIA